ncbi:MAG: hypothetical protein HKN24_08695 [Acidimicrobiales bacterium]|nr:hypothetical protein [Acidimicrobiales bacterium]
MLRNAHDPLDRLGWIQLDSPRSGDSHLAFGRQRIQDAASRPDVRAVDVAVHPDTGVTVITLKRLGVRADEDRNYERRRITAGSQEHQ